MIFHRTNKEPIALIHADGEALSPALAERITEADKSVGGELRSLYYLSPSGETISDDSIEMAKEKYFAYLSRECREITLEGLPADRHIGVRRFDLEHIFVSLYLNPSTEYKQSRLAILGDPGWGKTTLLKRLAIAYSFPDRRKLIDDNLPDQKWFPLLIRCQQLDNLTPSSIGGTENEKKVLGNV
jgi:hypothetical protein